VAKQKIECMDVWITDYVDVFLRAKAARLL